MYGYIRRKNEKERVLAAIIYNFLYKLLDNSIALNAWSLDIWLDDFDFPGCVLVGIVLSISIACAVSCAQYYLSIILHVDFWHACILLPFILLFFVFILIYRFFDIVELFIEPCYNVTADCMSINIWIDGLS